MECHLKAYIEVKICSGPDNATSLMHLQHYLLPNYMNIRQDTYPHQSDLPVMALFTQVTVGSSLYSCDCDWVTTATGATCPSHCTTVISRNIHPSLIITPYGSRICDRHTIVHGVPSGGPISGTTRPEKPRQSAQWVSGRSTGS